MRLTNETPDRFILSPLPRRSIRRPIPSRAQCVNSGSRTSPAFTDHFQRQLSLHQPPQPLHLPIAHPYTSQTVGLVWRLPIRQEILIVVDREHRTSRRKLTTRPSGPKPGTLPSRFRGFIAPIQSVIGARQCVSASAIVNVVWVESSTFTLFQQPWLFEMLNLKDFREGAWGSLLVPNLIPRLVEICNYPSR